MGKGTYGATRTNGDYTMTGNRELKIGLEISVSFTWPNPAAKVFFFRSQNTGSDISTEFKSDTGAAMSFDKEVQSVCSK